MRFDDGIFLRPNEIAHDDRGFVIAGSDRSGLQDVPTIWTSVDGNRWTRHVVPPEVMGTEGGTSWDLALTSTDVVVMGGDDDHLALSVIENAFGTS